MIFVSIERNNDISLSKQISNSIKDSILKGTLRNGDKLPSSRELSKHLNVARNVVIESYEQLLSEGYVYSKNG